MIDFRKRLSGSQLEKKVNPLEIYETLDRKRDVGPLRPSQEHVLKTWFERRRDKKNTIIKLHTGEGKTLIGLLILNSKLNSKDGPCLYICPNVFLFEQTCLEAERFGIPYCIFSDSEVPEDFINGEKILITYVQKVFHGYSKLGIDRQSIDVASVVLDDSHACIESIRSSFSVRVNNQHPLHRLILEIFYDDLTDQGQGTLLDIGSGQFDALLPIPYWAWFEKANQVTEAISKYKAWDEINYTWPLIKDDINKCQAYISGKLLEIAPYFLPVFKYGFFHNARNRILMSASNQDDAFLIKGLDYDTESIENPITFDSMKWSGEKLVLIPSLINEQLDRELIITNIAQPNEKRNYGVIAIVPDFKKTEQYEKLGSVIANTETISEIISTLKQKNFANTIVIANRYDGIDLPDETCRVLIMDSKPFSESLSERYEESVRVNSDIISKKIAQRIEQGMGRSVRGEKDYSVLILIGADLIQFIRNHKNTKFFSKQTQKQIEIGIKVADFAKEDFIDDGSSYFKIVTSLVNQVLKRDEGWKEYYKDEMDTIIIEKKNNQLLEVFSLEREAEESFYDGNYSHSAEVMQRIADKFSSDIKEKAWYIQSLARMTYGLSENDANKLQISAFKQNRYLLKPRDGINYEKLIVVEDIRVSKILEWVALHQDTKELLLDVDKILSDASFGVDSDKFEEAIKNIGLMLGFLSQRPDKEYKKGPDNLWCGSKGSYIFYECKSEVEMDRDEINKSEGGQMNTHSAWFEENYGKATFVKRIWIHPSKRLSYYCSLTHEVFVMRRGKLNELKKNIKNFFNEISKHPVGGVTESKVNEYLFTHRLDMSNILNQYVESIMKPAKS